MSLLLYCRKVIMNKKTVPFTSEQLENIIAQYPTPFHIYDEGRNCWESEIFHQCILLE